MPLRPFPTLALLVVGFNLCAQTTWRVDSLMTTWPVRIAVEEARPLAKPGVVRAIDPTTVKQGLLQLAPSLPLVADSNTVKYVRLYGEPRRDEFRALLGMAQLHFPLIEGELARQGLPHELKYVPMALSAMNNLCGDTEGRSGLWMLTYPVALRYGLTVNSVRDERRDPQLATMAAAHYLKDLMAQYKDPQLAVLAFACGPANVTRARQGVGGAKHPAAHYGSFTAAQRDVLPLLSAFVYLSLNAQKLGLEPLVIGPMEATDTLRSDVELHQQALALTLNIDPARLRALNPALCSDHVPAFEAFILPRGERAHYEQLADSIQRMQIALAAKQASALKPGADLATRTSDGREAIEYRVRSGDYLGRIAQRFGVKVSQLKTWNKLRSDHIDVGDVLVVYVPPSQRARYERLHAKDDDDEPMNSAPTAPVKNTVDAATPLPNTDFITYTVRQGDSLYAIARRYPGLDADTLMHYNGITAAIHPGQKLKIPKAQ